MHKVKKEKGSKVKHTSILGAVSLMDQINEMDKFGKKIQVSRLFDTVDINADPDKVMDDVTRELDFDLADFSEAKRLLENRLRMRRKEMKANEISKDNNQLSGIKQEVPVQPAPAQ